MNGIYYLECQGCIARGDRKDSANGYKNQQFKNPAVWKPLTDFAKLGDVDFITEDTIHFSKTESLIVAWKKHLEDDSKQAPDSIRVFYEIDSYLENVGQELPPLDPRSAPGR